MKDKLLFLLKIVVSLTLAVYFYQLVDFSRVAKALVNIDPIFYVLGVFLNYIGGITFQSMITRNTSRELNVSIIKMDAVNLGMRFYSLILPLAAVSAIRWHRYTKLGCSKTHAMLLMVLNKALQVTLISFFLLIGLVLFNDLLSDKISDISYKALILASLFIFVLSGFLSLGLMRNTRLNAFFYFGYIASRKISHHLFKYFLKIAKRLRKAIKSNTVIDQKVFLSIFIYSGIGFLIIAVSQYVFALSIGMDIDFLAILFMRAFVQLLMMFPISIAGLGLRELGFVSTSVLLGYSVEEGLALSLILLSMQVIFALMGMLLELKFIFKTKVTK